MNGLLTFHSGLSVKKYRYIYSSSRPRSQLVQKRVPALEVSICLWSLLKSQTTLIKCWSVQWGDASYSRSQCLYCACEKAGNPNKSSTNTQSEQQDADGAACLCLLLHSLSIFFVLLLIFNPGHFAERKRWIRVSLLNQTRRGHMWVTGGLKSSFLTLKRSEISACSCR